MSVARTVLVLRLRKELQESSLQGASASKVSNEVR